MVSGTDQADTLRQGTDSDSDGQRFSKKAVRCVAVASGKGGVGKTFFSVNMAVTLQRMGHKVLLLDADLGLANADILLGASPNVTLQDNIFSGVPLQETVVKGPDDVDLLAASSGGGEMLELGKARMQMLIDDLLEFASGYDVLVLDCAAGINESVMAFVGAAPQCALVTTPEPTAIMDAYALMKVADQRNSNGKFGIVMNMAQTVQQGETITNKLVKMGGEYLSVDVEKWGVIPSSSVVTKAVRAKKPVVNYAQDDPVADGVRSIAEQLVSQDRAQVQLDELDADGLLDGLFKRGDEDE